MSKMSDIAIEADELVEKGYSRKEANKIAMRNALERVKKHKATINSSNNKRGNDGNSIQK